MKKFRITIEVELDQEEHEWTEPEDVKDWMDFNLSIGRYKESGGGELWSDLPFHVADAVPSGCVVEESES